MNNWEPGWPNKTPWTHEQVVRLRELCGEGASFDDISREVGHSEGACRNKAKLMGYSTARSVAEQKCIPTVQKPEAPRRHQPWTKEEEQRLLVLATHRLSHAEIAEKLNRTTDAVTLRLSLLRHGGVDTKKSESEGRRRPCMCCGRMFSSKGSGNRLCKNCRHLDPGPEPARIVLR